MTAAWRLWTLIKRKAAPKKPHTARQKAARSAAAKKGAKTRAAHKKAAAKSPAPRSGTVARPKKAHSPRPATVAA